jgi:membrane protease subunit HflC
MRRNAGMIVLASVVVIAFGLYMVAFTVPFTQTAVVTRFGKVTHVIDTPGLHFKLPSPIERVYEFDKRLHVQENRLEQFLTADKQSVIATIFTTWRIAPDDEQKVVQYLKEIGQDEKAERVLLGLAHDAMGRVIGKHNFSDFVSTDPAQMKQGEIVNELKALIAEGAIEKYGIQVETIGIKRLELPEEATKKVFDRMSQERKQQATELRAKGDAEATSIRSEAKRDADDIKSRAAAEAARIRAKGQVEAAKYYKTFAMHPELHNFIAQLRALEKMYGKRATLFLDSDDPLGGSGMFTELIKKRLAATQPAEPEQSKELPLTKVK